MATQFNRVQFQSKMRAAQRKLDQATRDAQRKLEQERRRVAQHNQRLAQERQRQVRAYAKEVDRVNAHNQTVNTHNRAVDRKNRAALEQMRRQLRSASSAREVRYTDSERVLVDRVHQGILKYPDKEYDAFISYARIDGAAVGELLHECLEQHGLEVFFDEVAMQPGKSQSRQLDHALRRAQCGIALLTPAYLTGRFWTERELGALLHKETLIPVLHNVTFDDVANYSGILPDLHGFETSRDEVEIIADKIAAAILRDRDEEAS